MFAGAVAFMLAACASAPAPLTFDITAPRDLSAPRGAGAQMIVVEPQALSLFDTERIVVRSGQGVSYLSGVQWADRLPRLVQTRLVQSFENGSRLASVGRPTDRLTAAYQLLTEVRAFEVREDGREAVVEISAKLVNDRNGRIMAAQIFMARVPVAAIEGANATAALDQAAGEVFRALVRWASARA